MIKCLNCQTETENPQFCNRSCSASYTNKIKPKRKPMHHCKFCGRSINARKRYCSDECKQKKIELTRLNDAVKAKKPNSQSVIEWRQRQKVKAVEYKGGKCIICNYNKSLRALHFHHLDPSKKEFGIGSDGNTHSWESVKLELDKCILVCGNCHDEIHDGMYPQYLIVKEQ